MIIEGRCGGFLRKSYGKRNIRNTVEIVRKFKGFVIHKSYPSGKKEICNIDHVRMAGTSNQIG